MYENKTFENILQDALNQVDNSIDKRQGSIIYDALAPFSAELAKFYIDLVINQNLYLPDTATGDYLTRLASTFGVKRKDATFAVKRGLFYDTNNNLFDVPIGSRYSGGQVNYTVISRNSTGNFNLEAETAGSIGNDHIGILVPITFVNGLNYGTMGEVIVAGANVEDDEQLRKRLSDEVNRPAFGGNVSDYRQKVNSIAGVGECKIIPTWNGGGTVQVQLLGSDFNPPSSALVTQVQNTMDPTPQGNGIGLAPIGHTVTVIAVGQTPINVVGTFTLASGVTPASVKTDIENKLRDYLLGLRSNEWADSANLVVRISQVESRFLDVNGVLDVQGTTINGVSANFVVDGDKVPLFGSVTINV